MEKNNKMGECSTKKHDEKNQSANNPSAHSSDAAQNKSCHTGKCSAPRKDSGKSEHKQDEDTGTC